MGGGLSLKVPNILRDSIYYTWDEKIDEKIAKKCTLSTFLS
jgi:hypothetical protein